MTRYGMAIDLRRCIGCQACAAACKIANNLPKELTYNVVYTKTDDDFDTIGTAVSRGALANDNAGGTFPNCTLNFLPMRASTVPIRLPERVPHWRNPTARGRHRVR